MTEQRRIEGVPGRLLPLYPARVHGVGEATVGVDSLRLERVLVLDKDEGWTCRSLEVRVGRCCQGPFGQTLLQHLLAGSKRGMCLPGVERGFSGFSIAVFGESIPQHPRALGVGRRGRGEQRERGDRGNSTPSHHRLPSSAVTRFTVTRSCALQVRKSVTSDRPTLRT